MGAITRDRPVIGKNIGEVGAASLSLFGGAEKNIRVLEERLNVVKPGDTRTAHDGSKDPGIDFAVLAGVEHAGQTHLTDVAETIDTECLLFGLAEGRQKQTGENRNDRDDD